ncbi:MAG: CehA/McbA family metallohydrolase, partial [Deltaproteobacteria bacterium]|nr:CehA/McbA family metallohydrolase [Deltaproteobacteria bacterium]
KVQSAAADGLEIPVSTEHEYVLDFQPVVEQLGLTRWVRGMCGSELSTLVYGHFGVFPLVPDPTLPNMGATVWYHRLAPEVFDLVRAIGTQPALIINHPRDGGSIKGYFNAVGYDPITGTVENEELWDDGWNVIEAFNGSDFERNRDSTVVDWFSFLEQGRRVFAVGDSDSHHVRSDPVGWPRNSVLLGTDVPSEVTPEQVRDAVTAGHVVVTGGILVTATTASGAGPGDEERVAGEEATIHVVVQAPSWIDVDELEVIADGATRERIPITDADADPERPAVRFERDVVVPVRAAAPGSWVVFHARGDDALAPLYPGDGRRPFGLTNPIFLVRR